MIFSWNLFQMVDIGKILDIKTYVIHKAGYPKDLIVKRLSHCCTFHAKNQNGKILILFTFGEIPMQQNDYLFVTATGRYEQCGHLQKSKQLKQLYQLHLLWLHMVLMVFVIVLYNQDVMDINDLDDHVTSFASPQ